MALIHQFTDPEGIVTDEQLNVLADHLGQKAQPELSLLIAEAHAELQQRIDGSGNPLPGKDGIVLALDRFLHQANLWASLYESDDLGESALIAEELLR